MSVQLGFPPIVNKESRTLVLGSFPDTLSLQLRQYYAHPRNTFWRIVAETFGFDINSRYDVRVKKLKENGLGLWDVLKSCDRVGAADRNIRYPLPNDFRYFFTKYPNLRRVVFNGRKAEEIFRTLVPANERLSQIAFRYLPSTSPAHAVPYTQKLSLWQDGLD
jgi:hypoxanthine-DNA glycosylase